jgi:aryl-alcohol dehydrogenase-like predicted oxidoreductase
MKYRKLGRTGIEVSEVGFGAWAIGSHWGMQKKSDSIAALNKAIDMGVNFIDTARGYGEGKSEKIIGEVLKERSETITVATKIPPSPGPWPPSPYCKVEERYPENYLRKMLDKARTNLQRDCIDILQLHTWTRAWNENPKALDILAKLREEGKLKYIGVSTPEHDQNALIGLMRMGYLDTVQVIYNIFQQEPAAEFLPVAQKENVGVVVRMAFDEGVLTGKYTSNHKFPKEDFRTRYFAGDRLERAVGRVKEIEKDIAGSGFSMAETALKFSLSHPAVSTVIAGIRNKDQAERNVLVSDMHDLPEDILERLKKHYWLKAFWYSGK